MTICKKCLYESRHLDTENYIKLGDNLYIEGVIFNRRFIACMTDYVN